MSETRYDFAGWVAIAAAVLVAPLVLLGIAVRGFPAILLGQHAAGAVQFALLSPYLLCLVVQTLCEVLSLHYLRKMLNDRLHCHEADGPLLGLIVGTITVSLFIAVAKIAFALGNHGRGGAIAAAVILLMLAFVIGVLYVVLAIRLLRLPENPYGLMRTFAYLSMAIGIAGVSILLVPLALPLQIVSWVVLAMIFFRASHGEPEVEIV